MPSKDYRLYAASEIGKAARAKARAKWVAKRKEISTLPSDKFKVNSQPLLNAVALWR